MAGFISAGGFITWNGITIRPRSITYTSPEPETTTIPYLYDPRGNAPRVIPTGDYAGTATMSVEYTRESNGVNMSLYLGQSYAFQYLDADGYSLSLNGALLTQVTENISTGAVVTGTLEFQWTQFIGTP